LREALEAAKKLNQAHLPITALNPRSKTPKHATQQSVGARGPYSFQPQASLGTRSTCWSSRVHLPDGDDSSIFSQLAFPEGEQREQPRVKRSNPWVCAEKSTDPTRGRTFLPSSTPRVPLRFTRGYSSCSPPGRSIKWKNPCPIRATWTCWTWAIHCIAGPLDKWSKGIWRCMPGLSQCHLQRLLHFLAFVHSPALGV